MFTAAVMICLSNLPLSKENCLVLQSDMMYETEEECTSAVAYLLNLESFKYAYSGYSFKDYTCHNWYKTEV